MNTMNAELLDRILEAAQVGETTDWEFKSARGGFPGSFWETYSAFANADGGIVILGAREEDDGTVQLDGLTPAQLGEYQKILWDGLNNRGKVSRNLLANDDVGIVTIENASLLAIHVPRAARGVRPVYLGPTPFNNTYRRQHEGDYRCADDEVRRMLADADPVPADQRILSGFVLDDLDAASLTQYRQRFRAAKGEHAWLSLEDKELLERLGGWRRDRATGAEGITLAGLLMFGKDQVIRDPEAAPAYFVDYREKLDPATRWSDRVYPDGTWEANLFQFYQRVWPKLSTGLPVPFQLEGGMRRDETPVHEALREAFVNAMIHADYSATGGVVVERYPDRFMFENPGTLLVSLEQFRRGGVSECRNKSLQKMFLMIGGGEQAGSGVDKIRAGWRSRHWRAPSIRTQTQPDRVRLTLPMVSLIPDATQAHLRELFGTRIAALTPAEVQALATAEIEGSVSNARLQELLTDHPVDITRMLQRLCEQGFMVSDNRRRWTTYRLSGGPKEPSLFDTGDSSHLPGGSLHMERDSSHLGAFPEILQVIAAPVADKGRASPALVRDVIVRLCAGHYLTADELGKLLDRNPDGLRNRYLSPMVAEGLLKLRYPEAANQPDQAYTTADKKE
ncbi:MAG: ATP-binding protein [Acidiferrobacterales bacterium]